MASDHTDEENENQPPPTVDGVKAKVDSILRNGPSPPKSQTSAKTVRISTNESAKVEESSGKYSNWHFLFAILSIAAAVYLGLKSRNKSNDLYGPAGKLPAPYQKTFAPHRHIRSLDDIPNENGGWRLGTKADWDAYSVKHCDIDQVSVGDISPEYFEKEYRFKKPLLIHFPDGADGWTKSELWTLRSLLQSYGKWEVGSGRGVDIVRHGGNGHYRSTFETYVMGIMEERDASKEPFYMFDRKFYNESELPRSMHPPPYLSIHPVYDENIFFLGASMSGVSFHKHADAWNGVVFGWKRWFIYPPLQTPPSGVWPGLNTMEWFDRIYPKLTGKLKPLECMQGSGDIMYLPESWYHGTINIGDTIAIGIQKNIGQLHMENLTYIHNKNEDDPKLEQRVKLEKNFQIWLELHEHYPSNTEITNRLAENYAGRGDFRNGIATALKAVKQDPLFLVAHMNLGKMYFSMGEPDNAEKHFKKAIEINPHNSDVCWIYGEFLVFRRRVDEAIKWFEKGAREHVDKKDFFENLIRQARELVRLDPELKSIPEQKPKMMDHSFAQH